MRVQVQSGCVPRVIYVVLGLGELKHKADSIYSQPYWECMQLVMIKPLP
ncbi:hypothetical protein NTGM5_670046 [Candidatus Nitrotoga sp. M5]|nr:hypothetical protein NTGM5_670046 [Candidatus Nitrotoga sp. M5]